MSNFTEREKKLEPGESIFGILIVLIGVGGYLTAKTFSSGHYFAPDMFPKIVSATLVISGLIQVFFNYRRPKNDLPFKESSEEFIPKDVGVMTGMLIVYCFLLPKIHFIAASFLFMFAGMVYLHHMKKILVSTLIAALATAGLVAIFQYIFLVILP